MAPISKWSDEAILRGNSSAGPKVRAYSLNQPRRALRRPCEGRDRWLTEPLDERIVVLVTGNGLKDVASARKSVGEPFLVNKDFDDVNV